MLPLLTEKINALITDEVRALSIRRDIFEISFTPKGKELKYTDNGNWSRENRQTGKPGRIIKKLLVYEYKERDIEIFNNLLKAEIMDFGEWKIVSGDDICHWYDGDNYYKMAGSLGNSCMRHEECQCYFNVYKDHAKMLVCIKEEKLLGRAILWEINGETYMDRVYVCMDYLEEQFIQYAQSNGWYVRINQCLLGSGDDQKWLGPKDNYTEAITPKLSIKLRQCYTYFPYMDSFRYFNPDTCTIYSVTGCGHVCLDNTEGYWEDNTEVVECSICGNTATYCEDDENPYYWSEYIEEYLCPSCAVWNDYLETYISYRTITVDAFVNEGWMNIPIDVVESTLLNEPIKTPFPEDYFVKIGDKYYTYNYVDWDDNSQKFILKDVND